MIEEAIKSEPSKMTNYRGLILAVVLAITVATNPSIVHGQEETPVIQESNEQGFFVNMLNQIILDVDLTNDSLTILQRFGIFTENFTYSGIEMSTNLEGVNLNSINKVMSCLIKTNISESQKIHQTQIITNFASLLNNVNLRAKRDTLDNSNPNTWNSQIEGVAFNMKQELYNYCNEVEVDFNLTETDVEIAIHDLLVVIAYNSNTHYFRIIANYVNNLFDTPSINTTDFINSLPITPQSQQSVNPHKKSRPKNNFKPVNYTTKPKRNYN